MLVGPNGNSIPPRERCQTLEQENVSEAVSGILRCKIEWPLARLAGLIWKRIKYGVPIGSVNFYRGMENITHEKRYILA